MPSVSSRLSKIAPTTFLGALLRVPLRLLPKTTVVKVRCGINEGMRWIVGSGDHGCWLGHYEPSKQDLIRRLVKPGMNVFDVGANAGFYTLALSRLVGESGHVWAFEPLAENVANLRSHISWNAVTNVTVLQIAVSGSSGISAFATASSNSMGHLANSGDYLVPTISIDEVCALLSIDCPDFIKLDIEGGEGLALKGAARVLSRNQATVALALHGREQERICVAILRAARYDLRYLDGEQVFGDALKGDELVAFPPAIGAPDN